MHMSNLSSTSIPKSFSSGVLSVPDPPACTDTGGCPDPDAGSWTWPWWTSWGSHGPTSQARPGPSGWHPDTRACQLHHSACCHLQTCWHSIPLPRSLMEILNSTAPNSDPWGTSLVTGVHPDTEKILSRCWKFSHVKGNGVLQKLYVSIQNSIFQMQKILRKSAHYKDPEWSEINVRVHICSWSLGRNFSM